MPIFQKKKSLWQIKELEGYFNRIESHAPPTYDMNNADSKHQTLDQIVRENWEFLHSLEQDFVFSWFIEYQKVEESRNKNQKELESINQEITTTQQNAEREISELNRTLQELNIESANLENELNQKVQLAGDLAKAVHDKKLSVGELKEKLEHRIFDMKRQMQEYQKEFEANQIQLGEQFEQEVLKLDDEKLQLTETIEENKAKLEQLITENNKLKGQSRLLKQFQEKIKVVKLIIAEIPEELLEGEGV
ncbi:MAG: hypothetical protein ACTSRC_18860 [Candidatus Helarchaeota archaeon]